MNKIYDVFREEVESRNKFFRFLEAPGDVAPGPAPTPDPTPTPTPTPATAPPPAGLDPEEEFGGLPLPDIDINKVVTLKKIYKRLLALERIVDNLTDPKYIAIKHKVKDSVDLFHLTIKNITQFKDNVDGVINDYSDFLVSTTRELDKLNI